MNLMFLTQTRVPLWAVIVVLIVIMALILAVTLFQMTDVKWIGVVAGLISGLVIYLIGFIVDFQAFRALDRYRRMGIRDVLDNRHDKSYYKRVLSKSRNQVRVMGTSCNRFVTDFLDMDSDDKILIDRLRRCPKLKIQILIPAEEFIDPESSTRFSLIEPKLKKAQNQFGNRLTIRRFASVARQSIVIVDDEIIVGPVLPGMESRQSPAVHVNRTTKYGAKCAEYFDRVWEKGEAGDEATD